MQSTAAVGRPFDIRRLVFDVVRRHAAFLAIVGLYLVASAVMARLYGTDRSLSISLYDETFWIVMLTAAITFLLGHAVYVMAVCRPDRLTRYIIDDLRTNYLAPRRLLFGLLVLVPLPIFISVFSSLKMMIPLVQPFGWDPTFAAWDRTLHGGVNPWYLLQPVLGYPAVTVTLNTAYNLWLFVLFGIVFWQAFAVGDERLRMRFLLSFLLCWIVIGTIAATVLSSAGPVYYQRVTGETAGFGELMDYLRAVNQNYPVLALEVQEILWQGYLSSEPGVGGGISAMPSMHISSAVLFALVGWRTHRLLGIALTVFATLIFLGSIHLAWHYAIDGYVAVVMTLAIWKYTPVLVRWTAPTA